MALKLKMLDVKMHDEGAPDASVSVIVAVVDDAQQDRVVTDDTITYSGAALATMTQAQVTNRVRTDAEEWAKAQRSRFQDNPNFAKNISTRAKLSNLIGAKIDIPA